MRIRSRPTLGAVATPVAVLLGAFALLAAWPGVVGTAGATTRSVEFDGRQVQVPAGWPVHRLDQHPGMCVRLDRRAVYLGRPAANQRCPVAAAVGPQRAIVVEPRGAAAASRATLPRAPRPIATASAGSIFTGLGFDACTAPSTRTMAAWEDSPYRAIGVYIGGLNRGCSQPNLTASWVQTQTTNGWHLIPTYVGLQAPTSSCPDCAKLSSSQAIAQGNASAVDAVARASELGMGPGSPIYFDMESYTQTASATAATLAFLEAWTEKLHSLGYVSGVYSSSGSGIEDLANQVGTGYNLPDDIWIANWNGVASTSDPAVPSYAWTEHQRIKQYRGGHNETYGGVTINIDNNYVDAATVGSSASAGADDPIGFLDLAGTPAPGHVRVKGWAFDPSLPTGTLSIRVYIGGRAGTRGAAVHELGPIASGARADVGKKYPEAGRNHGFDMTFPTTKSGAQPVCVYAVGIAPGTDTLLGCKAKRIPVAVTFSNLRQTARGVRVRVSCLWPAGTACPGRLMLRTRFKVAESRRGRPPRIRSVTRGLGNAPFSLTGAQSRSVLVPLSAGGKALLRQRGKLRTQLIAAIPGGRRIQVFGLGG